MAAKRLVRLRTPSTMRAMPPQLGSRRLLVSLGAFAVATAWLLVRIEDYDLWFHLLIGKEVVRTGHIPATEFYVYPALGAASGFHEWGFGVLSYLVERVGGMWGLSLLNAALGAGALTLLAAASVRRGGSWWAALALLGPVSLFCAYRFCYRPEGVLYLAMGATIYCLERRWFFAVPVLTAALALFHPSPLILLLVFGCYAIDLAWEARRQPKRIALLFAVMVGSIATIAVVPYGLHQLTLPIEFTLRGDLTKSIAEFLPTLSTAKRWHFLVLALGAAAAVALNRSRRASDVLVAGFGYLALSHVRNVPLLALVAYGPGAVALTRAGANSAGFKRWAATAATASVATALFLASPAWGAGEVPAKAPARTADFVEEFRPRGRILNALHTGGYLAWRLFPAYLVAADGRTYYGESLGLRFSTDVLLARDGWREAVRAQGVTMISTPGVQPSQGTLIPIVAELDSDPEWALVVTEPAGMLFVRREALPRGAVEIPKSDIWKQVLAEAGAVMEVEALAMPPSAFFSRGVALFKPHDFVHAEQALAKYARLAPQDVEAAQFTRVLQAGLRGEPEAQAIVEEMYRRGRGL